MKKLLNRLQARMHPEWAVSGERYLHFYRKYHQTKNPIARKIHAWRAARIAVRSNAYLPLAIQFQGAVRFPHELSGIMISKGVVIGEGAVIFQQVTIGSNTASNSKRQGAPTLGKNVYVGAGAKIIGKVTIGDNVRIGANCIVVEDVPDNCTVVMPKPRIIQMGAARDNRFVEYTSLVAEAESKHE